MELTIHQLDTEGDTLLSLINPSPPFAQSLFHVLKPNALPQYYTVDEEQLWKVPTESVKTQMRLSSKHLKLASDYFRGMMAADWKESTAEDGFSFSVTADGWDEEVLLIVMRILHGRTTMIPYTVNLEMLAKVAVVVDYYQCHEATHFFTKLWIDNLKERLPTSFGRSLLLRFVVSCVFSVTLGALVKGMQRLGLLDPLPTSPFEGYSFMGLRETIKTIREPEYDRIHANAGEESSSNVKSISRGCSLKVKVNRIIDGQNGKANGLDLSDFTHASRMTPVEEA